MLSKSNWISLMAFIGVALVMNACQPKPQSHVPIQDGCPQVAESWDSLKAVDAGSFYSCWSRRMAPLQAAVPEPSHNDWLALHKEGGQLFQEYPLQSYAKDSTQNVIYLKKVGSFDSTASQIISSVGEYLSVFFQRPVHWMEELPLNAIPDHAKRINPNRGQQQIQTLYLLREVLPKEIPSDASMYLAFTAQDLYPNEKWNYVFGQASLSKRVGVWSIYRFGNAAVNPDLYSQALLRAIKTATHEAGHIYGIPHCTAWHCNMNGSNHLQELDRHPVHYCPEDYAKLSMRLRWKDQLRLWQLKEFWKRNGYHEQLEWYDKMDSRLYQQRMEK